MLKGVNITFETETGIVIYDIYKDGAGDLQWELHKNTTKEQTYFGNIVEEMIKVINPESVVEL